MKRARNGIIPTRKQKEYIKAVGYDPTCWNVVKEEAETIIIINKTSKATEIIKK